MNAYCEDHYAQIPPHPSAPPDDDNDVTSEPEPEDPNDPDYEDYYESSLLQKRCIIPNPSVSLEYFIFTGEQSYIDRRCMELQKYQFSCLACNVQSNVFYHQGNKFFLLWKTLVPQK